MRAACALPLAAAAAAARRPMPRTEREENGDSWVGRSGRQTADHRPLPDHPPTIPLWADKPRMERGTPPYTPPDDWTYNTKGGPVEGKINVHLVPHTHDDTGWQVTVDQYFFSDVYYVLDTVIPRLAEDPNRRFMYVETAFFARWWDQQPKKKKDLTKRLVENGQLEFINGGWCMHDEAAPYWVEMVDQTTRGHQFLKKNFGKSGLPKGTWQIDPFGHSNTNAWLIGAESGMDFLFWGRMDYQDFAVRKNQSRLEWIWQGSQSLGKSAQVFAGELFGGGGGGYSTWINYDGNGDQVQDDPSRHDYNIDKLVDQFVQNAQEQDRHIATNHQLWATGTDFQYQNADHWYHNLDKLMHYVNLNGTVNAFYSTPSVYVDQKKKAQAEWEVRQDDIFPLGDNAHNYWSGYFTSRPSLKRQVRFASNFLNAARQLEVITQTTKAEVNQSTERPSPPVGDSWTDSLEGTVGVATHHDGMSGTERQDVSNDYEQRISESHGEVEQGVAVSLRKLLGSDAALTHCNCNSMGADTCLNISVCAATTGTDSFSVAAYNPLAQATTQWLRVPVNGDQWKVTALAGGAAVPSQTARLDNRTLSLPLLYINYFNTTIAEREKLALAYSNKADHVLMFLAELPPMGYATFTARVGSAPAPAAPRDGAREVSNGVYKLTLNASSVTSVTNLKSGVTTPFAVSWGWYNSSVGGCTAGLPSIDYDGKDPFACSGQKSGAYMFRPNTSQVFYPGPARTPSLSVVDGAHVIEIYQTFSDWATHVIRLYKDPESARFIEVEWTAGPIPVDTPWFPAVAHNKTDGTPFPNHWGKEVIVKYSTGLQSGGEFYTDSNGKEMVLRKLNKRGPSYPPLNVSEPVAGNYYPVNAMIAVQSDKAEMVVLTDVSQGGASLQDGEIEMMVHRRILADDSRGVQEPLNETMCGCNDINAAPGKMGAHGHLGDGGCECAGLTMRGRHLIVVDAIDAAHELRRQLMETLSFPATLAFTPKAMPAPKQPTYSAISAALPKNVKLLTLTSNYASMNDGALLLRLAHLYSVGEHPTLSAPVSVNLTAVFSEAGLTIASADETQLTATMPAKVADARKHEWKTYDPTGGAVLAQLAQHEAHEQRPAYDAAGLTVTLRPMEVRTFLAKFA